MEFNRPISPLPTPHAATSPFAVLRAAASRLPLSVPLAQSTDMIIKFSGDPAAEFETGNYDSAWEMTDPMLNAILGKNDQPLALSARQSRPFEVPTRALVDCVKTS